MRNIRWVIHVTTYVDRRRQVSLISLIHLRVCSLNVLGIQRGINRWSDGPVALLYQLDLFKPHWIRGKLNRQRLTLLQYCAMSSGKWIVLRRCVATRLVNASPMQVDIGNLVHSAPPAEVCAS